MPVKVFSCMSLGLKGLEVEVEADILNGLSAFSIVGLGDSAVQESKERIRSAIKNSGADYPKRKKIINLAPASLRKQGPQFDLPIAVSLLAASGQIDAGALSDTLIIGELALDGGVRAIHGVITAVIYARDNGWKRLVVPAGNYHEARLVPSGVDIVAVNSLNTLVRLIKTGFAKSTNKEIMIPPTENKPDESHNLGPNIIPGVRFKDIIGQSTAKRALAIAAAGGHHIALCGSPGIGKTMLARALAAILPPLKDEEKMEVLQIYSAAGMLAQTSIRMISRPFREVHQTITPAALYGGGSLMKPGEITLAHRGVLFMDEFPEFPRAILEQLRGPMEEKQIRISRVGGTISYPAQFTLVAGMNPCPCGYFGDPRRDCICRPYQLIQYGKKISGPIADRLDMFVELLPVSPAEIKAKSDSHVPPPVSASPAEASKESIRSPAESSVLPRQSGLREKIIRARAMQMDRFLNEKININAEMNPRQLKKYCRLDGESLTLLNKAASRLGLSMRKYHQAIRIARTIADLENSPAITAPHIAEALQYRRKNSVSI